MTYKNYFLFLFFVFAVLIVEPRIASACSCGAKPTVLDAYEGANVIIVAKAVSVEKSAKGEGVDGVSSTTMIVEKVFKGNLKVGDEMIFAQGGGADCIWTFNEESVGKEFLFYLSSREKSPKVWIAFGCGRSNGLKYATDDLLYLNKLNKVRGKTRISGTIEFAKDTDLSVEGRKIRILRANKTYEVKTDKNGVFEIYDLPAGKYLIEPELPFGWKVDRFWLSYSHSFIGNDEDTTSKKISIILEAKKHAGLDIHFEIDNAIRGKVYDQNGKPMKDVCLKAVQPQSEKSGGYYADCTDEDGSFAITELQRGSYVLVINDDGKISSSEPFKSFYYPNVLEREKATVIAIGEGVMLEGINIYVHQAEETITVEGMCLYSDGKPVIDEGVQFKVEKTPDNVEGNARAVTDSNGRFSIKILNGLKGKLYGEMNTYIGEFENCPKLESIIKKTGRSMTEIKTSVVEIQATNDVYNVELKYPFPSCKKAE